MKRKHFIVSAGTAAALTLAPLKGMAVSSVRDPSMRPHLSGQVIVKYDRWILGDSFLDGIEKLAYRIRFTVVPAKFAGITYDPTRCYLTICEQQGERELIPCTYNFFTFSSDWALGPESIKKLKESVRDGTALLTFHIPGNERSIYHTSGAPGPDKPFLKMVQFMEKFVNEDYEKVNGVGK